MFASSRLADRGPTFTRERIFVLSTSKLQRQVSILLSTHLGQYTIRENTRPEWLEGLELDFYIEELSVGIEVQGQQHFAYIPYFHGSYAEFLALKKRDERKANLCQRLCVTLHYVENEHEVLPLVEQLAGIELPPATHPNYLEYLKRLEEKLIRHKAATTPALATVSAKHAKHAKSYLSKIRRYRRLLRTATGETTISNLERGIKNQVAKLSRRIGAAEAQRLIAEEFKSKPY